MPSLTRILVVFVFSCLLFACGVEGPSGPAGAEGPKGDPGVTLVREHICEGLVYPAGTTGGNVYVRHEVYRYADQSVFTSCVVNTGYDDISAAQMYRMNQQGAAGAICSVGNDIDDSPSRGRWEFSIAPTGATTTARYLDKTSIYDAKTFTLDCQTY